MKVELEGVLSDVCPSYEESILVLDGRPLYDILYDFLGKKVSIIVTHKQRGGEM